MDKEIELLKQTKISYYRESTSHNKIFSLVIIFGKRIIRKLLKFIIQPLIDDINEYHDRLLNLYTHHPEVSRQKFYDYTIIAQNIFQIAKHPSNA